MGLFSRDMCLRARALVAALVDGVACCVVCALLWCGVVCGGHMKDGKKAEVKAGSLTFVDLAGIERVSRGRP